MAGAEEKNVMGSSLSVCSLSPLTGWYRDGYCRTDRQDQGSHTGCAELTQTFLEYTKSLGNDLSTPRPQFGFPGLVAGDRWCLCWEVAGGPQVRCGPACSAGGHSPGRSQTQL